jgi:hypothetical protein
MGANRKRAADGIDEHTGHGFDRLLHGRSGVVEKFHGARLNPDIELYQSKNNSGP